MNVLVATDIAARGLDIAQLPLVVNYDLPLVAEDYIHRVGRTGRAGRSGRAVSLVSAPDSRLLRDIQRLLASPLESVGELAPVAAAPPRPAGASRPAPGRPQNGRAGRRSGRAGRRPTAPVPTPARPRPRARGVV